MKLGICLLQVAKAHGIGSFILPKIQTLKYAKCSMMVLMNLIAKAFEEGYVCIDSDIQDQIDKKGLNGPRIKPSDVVDQINKIQWVQEGVLTICIITMQNGFIVTGESACADPDNFDEMVGKEVAKRNAMNKIWPLLGYALREKLHKGTE